MSVGATWKCRTGLARSSRSLGKVRILIFKCELFHFLDVGRIYKNPDQGRVSLGAAGRLPLPDNEGYRGVLRTSGHDQVCVSERARAGGEVVNRQKWGEAEVGRPIGAQEEKESMRQLSDLGREEEQ